MFQLIKESPYFRKSQFKPLTLLKSLCKNSSSAFYSTHLWRCHFFSIFVIAKYFPRKYLRELWETQWENRKCSVGKPGKQDAIRWHYFSVCYSPYRGLLEFFSIFLPFTASFSSCLVLLCLCVSPQINIDAIALKVYTMTWFDRNVLTNIFFSKTCFNWFYMKLLAQMGWVEH